MENQDYIKKWLEGTLSEEEMRAFEKTDDFKSLVKLSKSLNSLKAPEFDTLAEYGRLKSRMASRGKVVAMSWLNPVLKIAAVLTVLTGSYFFFLYDSLTVVKTLAAEKKELILPDASFVALNPLSQLSFSEKKWKKARKVTLDGEAFFKVAKGSKFEVETSAGTVSVLGTAFSVKNRKDYFEVVCYEGSVKVESSQEISKLLPGQMFRVLNGIAANQTVAEENVPAWRADESTFKSVPFSQVIGEFERQYNVTVTISDVDTNQLFTGTFTHNDMSLALKSITIPLNLTYLIADDKKIVVTGDIQ